jgi:hypothetical protein
MMKIWISRDKDGVICLWHIKPVWCTDFKEWYLPTERGCLESYIYIHTVKALCGFTPKKGKLYEYTPKGRIKEAK